MFGFFKDDYEDTFNIASVAANDFVRLSLDYNVPINNNKLHMLMFVANGWYMVYNNAPMIDENFIATWVGPVIPSTYEFFSKYGTDPIRRPSLTWVYGRDGRKRLVSLSYGIFDYGAGAAVEEVWEKYGNESEEELMNRMLDCKNHPYTYIWQVKSNFGRGDTVIPNKLIDDFFRPMLNYHAPTKV